MNALLIEAAEEGGRAGPVETLIVIKDPNLQDQPPPQTASDERRSGIS